jgi:hypothetical protein
MTSERTIPKTGPLAPTRCSSCGAPILFVVTGRGKTMPVDLRPSPDGTIAIEQAEAVDGPFWESEVVPEAQRAGKVLRKAHWATCRFADQHRKPR